MSATFWNFIIAGILALAAVLIFLNRRGIRSRFVRNMPIDRPYERPSWLPVPRLALPPSEPSPPATEHGWLMRGEQAVFAPPAPKRKPTAEEDRARLVEAIEWDFLRRHAPDPSPAEAFEKAEAWQRIMEERDAIRTGIRTFPPGAAIVAGEPVAIGEDGKVRPIEKREPKL